MYINLILFLRVTCVWCGVVCGGVDRPKTWWPQLTKSSNSIIPPSLLFQSWNESLKVLFHYYLLSTVIFVEGEITLKELYLRKIWFCWIRWTRRLCRLCSASMASSCPGYISSSLSLFLSFSFSEYFSWRKHIHICTYSSSHLWSWTETLTGHNLSHLWCKLSVVIGGRRHVCEWDFGRAAEPLHGSRSRHQGTL